MCLANFLETNSLMFTNNQFEKIYSALISIFFLYFALSFCNI